MNNSTPAVEMGVVIKHAELLIEMAQHVPEVERGGVKNHIAPIGMAEQPKWKWGALYRLAQHQKWKWEMW